MMKKLILRTTYRLAYLALPALWRFTRPNVFGAMVAVRCGDRILFIRNSYRPEWSLPGGGIEPGEAPVETAARELGEETGWHVEPAALRPVGEILYVLRHRNDHVTLFSHAVEAERPVAIDGIEVVEARFLTRAEAESRHLQPHVRHFLGALYG